MRKQILATCLAIITLFSTMTVGYALELKETDAGIVYPADDIAMKAEAERDATAHTIKFDASVLLESETELMYMDMVTYEDAQLDMIKAHNISAAQQAKDYVRKLNLSESGYGYIEEFCLEELDYYMNMEDAQLLSYTVYTPNQHSVTTLSDSPTEEELRLFGTYGGRDFYYFYPSSAEVKTNVKKQETKAKLQGWVNNVIGCVLEFESIKVNALWSAFQLLMGAPSDYIVQTGAFTESYCNLTMYTRGLYTEYGNGTYEMLSSQQYCAVYPYKIFHPVDSPNYSGAYVKDYGYQGQIYSNKYMNSPKSLCQEAWQIYNGALVVAAHDTINTSAFKTIWEDL